MHAIHCRYADVDGQHLFYRKAGATSAPAVVLLPGFPASPFMSRDLIPPLSAAAGILGGFPERTLRS